MPRFFGNRVAWVRDSSNGRTSRQLFVLFTKGRSRVNKQDLWSSAIDFCVRIFSLRLKHRCLIIYKTQLFYEASTFNIYRRDHTGSRCGVELVQTRRKMNKRLFKKKTRLRVLASLFSSESHRVLLPGYFWLSAWAGYPGSCWTAGPTVNQITLCNAVISNIVKKTFPLLLPVRRLQHERSVAPLWLQYKSIFQVSLNVSLA